MSEKEKGLYNKYIVTKPSSPTKKIDCIVLEFDDPIAQVGLQAWADEMIRQGFVRCGVEVIERIEQYQSGTLPLP